MENNKAPLSAEELDKLEALAHAATPGPWQAVELDDEPCVEAGEQYICQTIYDHQSVTYRDNPSGHIADAQFIAAANPAAILALIAEARAALAAPVAAQADTAEPRPTDDHLWDATLRDRDTYHEWADKLADSIAAYFGVEIGEHSNMNLPWAEALEAIENADRAPSTSAGEAYTTASVSYVLCRCALDGVRLDIRHFLRTGDKSSLELALSQIDAELSHAPVSQAVEQPADDAVVEANRQLLLDRSRVGVSKYGVTLRDAGLSQGQLMQHALEEALDLANYLQTLIQASKGATDGAVGGAE